MVSRGIQVPRWARGLLPGLVPLAVTFHLHSRRSPLSETAARVAWTGVAGKQVALQGN